MTTISHDGETLAQGQQVISVTGFIHHKFDGVEKVFLAKRADTKKFLPGVHEMPGGHVDYGETPVAALKREVDEELGMSINVGDLFYEFSYVNEIKGSHSIEVIYFASVAEPIENVEIQPEDHSDYGWFAEDELVNATTTNKGMDDDEFVAMRKGFALLRGEPIKF